MNEGKVDTIKQLDQINLLEVCLKYTDTGFWDGVFSYPSCGSDLVSQGLATIDKKITIAGRAVLWFLGKSKDPTLSKSFVEIKLKKEDGGG